MERIAIVDLGSNALRMNIIEIANDGSFKIINELSETVRLSENMSTDNLLKAEAMNRTIEMIKLFKGIIISWRVMNVIAVTTAAARNAFNGKYFVDMVYEETGIQFQIISGNREAELGLKAVFSTLKEDSGYVVDIGGASTEITLFIDKKNVKSVSLPIGVVILTERFGLYAGNAMEEFIFNEISKIDWLIKGNEYPVIAVGGTAKVLGDMIRANLDYSINSSYNFSVRRKKITSLCEELIKKDIEDRKHIVGLPKDRADVILTGAIIIKNLIKVLETNEFLVCNNGIRGGLFYEYYLNKYDMVSLGDICQFSIDNIAKLYKLNTNHSKHVNKIALNIYSELKEIGILEGTKWEDVLSLASQLHDAGIYISFENKEMHTYHLIINSPIFGISHEDLVKVSIVASKFEKEKIGEYIVKHSDIVSIKEKEILQQMTAILELADRLDRSKQQLIKELKIKRNGDIIVFEAFCEGDWSLEQSESNRYMSEFEDTLNIRAILV